MRRLIEVKTDAFHIQAEHAGIGLLFRAACDVQLPALPRSVGVHCYLMVGAGVTINLVAPNGLSKVDAGHGPQDRLPISGQSEFHLVSTQDGYLLFGQFNPTPPPIAVGAEMGTEILDHQTAE